jgi:hypothetical protein
MADIEGHEGPAFSPNAVHLIRTVQQIHVQLSAMADHKASILMGATFVIFTIAMGQGAQAPLPLLILGATAFVAAVLAVLSILPALRHPIVASPNLLFFGSFAQLPEEKFIAEMLGKLHSEEDLYRAMLRDLYQNGVVLERKKYRLLGYAYRVFLIGLTASFSSFVLAYLHG